MSKVMVLGEEFEVTVEQENFIELNKRVQSIKRKRVEEFRDDYDDYIANNHPHRFMRKHFDAAIDEVIEILNDNNVYSVSAEEFINKYADMQAIDEVCESVQSRIDAIREAGEDEKLYREIRKANRTQYRGAGYGMVNAISASIEAKMMNAATGAAHSLFNSVGNMKTDRKVRDALSRAYRDSKTPIIMEIALSESIENLIYPITKILKEEENMDFTILTDEEKTKAKNILDFISEGKVPAERIDSQLIKSWSLNPYSQRLYETMLSIKGDVDGAIGELSSFFGLDVSEYKENIVLKAMLDFSAEKGKDLEDWDIALQSIQIGKSEAQKYNIQIDKLEDGSQLKVLFNELDAGCRTVDGVLYDDAETAKNIRDDKKVFLENVKYRDILDEANYNAVLEELKGVSFKSEPFKQSLVKMLETLRYERDESTFKERAVKLFESLSIYSGSLLNKMIFDISSQEQIDKILANHKGVLTSYTFNNEKAFFYYYDNESEDSILITRSKVHIITSSKLYTNLLHEFKTPFEKDADFMSIALEADKEELEKVSDEFEKFIRALVKMVVVMNENYPKTKYGVFSKEEIAAVREKINLELGDLSKLSVSKLEEISYDLNKQYSKNIIFPIIEEINKRIDSIEKEKREKEEQKRLQQKKDEFNKLIDNYQSMQVGELESLLVMLERDYKFDFAVDVIEKIKVHYKILQKQIEAEKRRVEEEKRDYKSGVEELCRNWDSYTKEELIAKEKLLTEKAKKEVDEICKDINIMDRIAIEEIKDKLSEYPKNVREPYIKLINERLHQGIKKELDDICTDIEKMDYFEVVEAYNKIYEVECDVSIKQEYIVRIEKRRQATYCEAYKDFFEAVDVLLNKSGLKSANFGTVKDVAMQPILDRVDKQIMKVLKKWETPLVIHCIEKRNGTVDVYMLLLNRFIKIENGKEFSLWDFDSDLKFGCEKKLFKTKMFAETKGRFCYVPNSHEEDVEKYVNLLNEIIATVRNVSQLTQLSIWDRRLK